MLAAGSGSVLLSYNRRTVIPGLTSGAWLPFGSRHAPIATRARRDLHLTPVQGTAPDDPRVAMIQNIGSRANRPELEICVFVPRSSAVRLGLTDQAFPPTRDA